jgi:hypothetical protein
MSTNTQAQGRTFYTERDFAFTPTAGEDATRTLARWEIELQRQLFVGDVTKDGAAKQAALDAPYMKVFAFTPSSVTGVTGKVGTVQNTTLTTAATVGSTTAPTGFTAAVTTGTLPAGLAVSVSGSTVKLTGTPTAAGALNVTVTVSKDGFTSKTFTVVGTIAA